jgi:precorrin-8X/cobalt-precorrin-8 methylmutase
MLYDHHIAVDWSANGSPKRGKDSIWISEDGGPGENPRTRHAAMEWISARIETALSEGERLHIGFDFAFGLPRDAGAGLLGEAGWEAYWRWLSEAVEDAPTNASNRFAVAGQLNARTSLEGPFWGHPHQHAGRYPGLSPTRCVKGKTPWPHPFAATRYIDEKVSGAQEVWKLSGAGSVGSQALLGIAALQKLRTRFADQIAIWPFETGFAERLSAPILITEIYPSLGLWDFKAVQNEGETADEAQVRAVSKVCAEMDRDGRFRDVLNPSNITFAERQAAIREEGWILGV